MLYHVISYCISISRVTIVLLSGHHPMGRRHGSSGLQPSAAEMWGPELSADVQTVIRRVEVSVHVAGGIPSMNI